MTHKSEIERHIEAGHSLAAKPPSSWTDADILAAHPLLMKCNESEYDNSFMNELENAMGEAPITSLPAALAKVRWLIEQPCGEEPDRQPWEPAAYLTLRDFLSPKSDFVAELGLRMGQTIRRAGLADVNFRDAAFSPAVKELEAIDVLIEASVPTSLQGVTTQMVVAMGHLENLRVMTECGDKLSDDIYVEDIHEFVERTKSILDVAVPVLAAIAGIDLQADLAVDYRTAPTDNGEPTQESPATAPTEVPVNPWAESIAGYVSAPAEWWNDDRLSDAVGVEAETGMWIGEQCELLPPIADGVLEAICKPGRELIDAIVAAPVRGNVGARAKLRMLASESRDMLSPDDIVAAIQTVLAGLPPDPQDESSSARLQKAA